MIPLLITDKFNPIWERFLELQPAALSRNAWICSAIEQIVTEYDQGKLKDIKHPKDS